MTKLDKWDSQILLLSKGHFDAEIKRLNVSKPHLLKYLWANRCSLRLEHVTLDALIHHLVKMLYDLGLLQHNRIIDLLYGLIDFNPKFNRYGFKRNNELTIKEDLINNMLNEISTIPVLDDYNKPKLEYQEKYTDFLDNIKQQSHNKREETRNCQKN